jgi:hypothetical protein
MADSFLWQHSFPTASILLICLLAQYTLCFFLVAIFHQLMSTWERASYYLKQPSPSMPWYGLILQPLSKLFSAGSFSEEEVRTPRTCRRSPHSPLIQILKDFPVLPCRGASRCGLCLVDGGGVWCWCGVASHAARSVAACNRGPPSSTSASTSGLSRPVLPRRLWRVVGWLGFLLGRDWWGGERVVGGVLPRINIGTNV